MPQSKPPEARRRAIAPVLKKCAKWVLIVLGVGALGLSVHFIGFHLRCRNAQASFAPITRAIAPAIATAEASVPNYTRDETSTYLTFPEWYLVFNPQEYARFITVQNPSKFGYFRSIGQFWSGYCQVYGITGRHYHFNFADHLMDVVIGTSFSVEYAARGVWENTLGRLTSFFAGTDTDEDRYMARVATEYGQYIPAEPFYTFPYWTKLRGMWTRTSFFGPHMLRKWERKMFFTLDYGVKIFYCSLIKVATRSLYGVADTEVFAAVASSHPKEQLTVPGVRVLQEVGNGYYLVALPHYQGFTDAAPALARSGLDFVDIAGNDEVLVTVVVPKAWEVSSMPAHPLFSMEMMTSSQKRVALQVPVDSLAALLRQFDRDGVQLEHIFDF